jgi:hypothetical protein
MMNTPSMYSVDQLLKARQNGVPDYVVVPMLQKAMAQKQAMAQQQALQQGAPKPPVAQQILDAAHNDVMQEHMARRPREEAKGIDSLPSNIDEEDYAGGGIVAFDGTPEKEGGDGSYVEDDLVTLPDIVKKRNNLLGQSKNDVPKDYSDVAANVLDGKDLLTREYSQFDNPDDVITKWRGKGAKNLPIYKENVRNWLKESGWKEGDKLNLKDDKDLNRMVAAIANQEMSAHLKPEHIPAIASGKYKFADGAPAPSKQSTQQGIASLPEARNSIAYPAAPEDMPMPHSKEEESAAYKAKELQDLLGEDPNAARREARLSKREADLAEEKDRSPWMALMQAGLSTMAGTSPNALSNIGAGATEGLKSYGEARKDISKSSDKLMDLRDEVETAQRAEKKAIKLKGFESAEAAKAANIKADAENKLRKYEHGKWAKETAIKEQEAYNKGEYERKIGDFYEYSRPQAAEDKLTLDEQKAIDVQLKEYNNAVNEDIGRINKSLQLTDPDKYDQMVNSIKLEKARGYPILVKSGRIQLPTPSAAPGAPQAGTQNLKDLFAVNPKTKNTVYTGPM